MFSRFSFNLRESVTQKGDLNDDEKEILLRRGKCNSAIRFEGGRNDKSVVFLILKSAIFFVRGIGRGYR